MRYQRSAGIGVFLFFTTLIGICSDALADTQVYGLLSAGIVSGNGFSRADESMSVLSEQGHSSNRWGLRGTEELGQGLRMSFMLESSLSLRTGAAGRDSSSLFDREAHLAFHHPVAGAFRAGRGKNLLYELADDFDARGNWNFGALKSASRYAGFYSSSGVSRFDHMLRYSSPEWAGVRLDGAYTFGGQPGDSRAGSGYVIGARYRWQSSEFGYAHAELRTGSVPTDLSQRVDLIVAKTKASDLTLNLGYARTRNPTGGGFASIIDEATVTGRTSADTWFAGLRYPVSEAVTINAGYYDVRDKVSPDGRNNVRMLAAGLVYALSSRTELYVDVARAWREPGASAAFTIYDRFRSNTDTPSESTRNQRAVNIGLQHRF
jgi:predicted porin